MRIALAFLLSFMLATGMFGCKDSDTLTEHIEDPINGIIDEDVDALYEDVPNANPDPNRASSQLSDSDREDEQTAQLPDYNKENQNEQQTNQREQDITPHDQAATEGDEESDDSGDNDSVSTGSEVSSQSSGSGTGDSNGSTETTEKQSGEGNISPEVAATGGRGGDATVVDLTGEGVTPPEAGTIAATGQYAYIVEMIGGQGALSGTSQDFKDEVATKGLFPGEGIENQAVVFEGSHETGYTVNVDVLINETTANVIIIDGSEVTLSAEDQQRILEAGITVAPMNVLGSAVTSDAAVTQSVSTVADMLKSSPYINTDNVRTRADLYTQMHDNAINTCLDNNGGAYTVKMIGGNLTSYSHVYQEDGDTVQVPASSRITTAYVDSWVSAVVSQLDAAQVRNANMDSSTGIIDASVGIALSLYAETNSYALIDYYLQVAGVVDTAYDTERLPSKAALIAPGYAGGFMSTEASNYHIWASSGTALWYPMNSDSAWIRVGSAEFPAILVGQTEWKDNIKQSAATTGGLYNVGAPYYVWVVPTGVCGQWTTGTPESFLLAPWALYMFKGGADLTDFCSIFVDDFYTTFYRVDSGAYASLIDNLYQTDDIAGA